MSQTTIEWARNADGSQGQTWNPVRGCTRVSPGCKNCYAERMAARGLPGMLSPTTGQPFAVMTPSGPHWTGKVELMPHMLDIPLRRKVPTTYFVNSMSDLWHKELPLEDIAKVYAAMRLAHWHTYQVLTKRPEIRQKAFESVEFWDLVESASGEIADAAGILSAPEIELPAPHIWEGVSVENRACLNRIDLLRETPAAVRFLSLEPLLEDLGDLKLCDCSRLLEYGTCGRPHIDWAIVGGESGPGARPLNIDWVRSIIEQCKAAGVACFVKQLGPHPFEIVGHGFFYASPGHSSPVNYPKLKDRKGGSMEEWPEDLRVRQMPSRNHPTQKETAQ